jgi:uncharacterized phage-like protein YoqJ
MAKQRTFGDLKQGSYFWSANSEGIDRRSVGHITIDEDEVIFSTSYYVPAQHVKKADRVIENEPARIYWYVDKKDAQRKAIDLKKKAIKDVENQLSVMRRELANMMNKYKVW